MSESQDDENETDASDYTCTCCSEEFSSVTLYQTHRSEQSSCGNCDKRFCNKEELRDHSSTCLTELICEVCQAKFYSPTAFKEHHDFCSALTCNVCQMKFISLGDLKLHKSFKHKFCKYCKGSFSNEGFARHKLIKHFFKCGKCSYPFTTSVGFLELKGIPKLCVACLVDSKSSHIKIAKNASPADACSPEMKTASEKNVPPEDGTATVRNPRRPDAEGESAKAKCAAPLELCYTVEAFQSASKTGRCPYCLKKIPKNMECHMKICVQVCNYIRRTGSTKGYTNSFIAEKVIRDSKDGNNADICVSNKPVRNESVSVPKLNKNTVKSDAIAVNNERNSFLFEEVISNREEDGDRVVINSDICVVASTYTLRSEPERNNLVNVNTAIDTADNDVITIDEDSDGEDDNNEGSNNTDDSNQIRKKSDICVATGIHKVGDKPEKNNSMSVSEVNDAASRGVIAVDEISAGEVDNNQHTVNTIDSNQVSENSNISVATGSYKVGDNPERNNLVSVYEDSDVIIVDDDSDIEIDNSEGSINNYDSRQVSYKSNICVATGTLNADTSGVITVDEVDLSGVDNNQVNASNSNQVCKTSDVCVAVSIHTVADKLERNKLVSVYKVNNDPVSIDSANSDVILVNEVDKYSLRVDTGNSNIVTAVSDDAVDGNAVCVEKKKTLVWSNALERYGETVDKIFNTVWMRPNWNCHNCQICGARMKSHQVYRLHLNKIHGMTSLFDKIQRFRCNECRCRGDSIEDVNLHIYNLHERSVQCSECSHLSISHKENKLHLHTVHPESVNKCYQCDAKFSDSMQLKLHRKDHYTNDVFDCDVCGKKIKGKLKFTAHQGYHKHQHRRYLCPFCGKICNDLKNLTMHVRAIHLHEKSRMVLCPDCGLLLKKRSYARHWEKTHSGNLYPCTVCSKNFPTRIGLKQHRLTHVIGRNYRCDWCPAAYKQLKNLRYHKSKAHSATTPPKTIREPKSRTPPTKEGPPAEKKPKQPAECPVCLQKFPPNRLNRHLATHGVSNPAHFRCTKCDESFSSAGVLRNHVKWIHIGERNFPCSYCSAKFKRRDALVIHVRRHTGERPYSCGVCHRQFRQHTDCKKHEAKHAPPGLHCDKSERIQSSSAGSFEEFDKNSASDESNYAVSEEDLQAATVFSRTHEDYT